MKTSRYLEIMSSILALTLLGCSSGGGNDTETPVALNDTETPVALIAFPTPNALTESNTITVRGSASDNTEVAMVRVNGINASSTDQYANWTATVPLIDGSNLLTVEVEDHASNVDTQADQIMINKARYFVDPDDVVLDNANNRALVLDQELYAIVSVDLSSGVSTILSDNTTPDTDIPFTLPNAMVMDESNNRLIVLESNKVKAVDLTTGMRSIISDNTTPNAVALFHGVDISINTTNNSVYVADNHLKAIISVNLADGSSVIVSDNNTPNDTNPFGDIKSLIYYPDNNEILVGTFRSIIAVNLPGGQRSILSNPTIPDNTNILFSPSSLSIDYNNNRLLVADSGRGVLAVDLSSGTQSYVSGSSIPDSTNLFRFPTDLAIDAINNQAYVVDNILGELFNVDLADGSRTLVTRNRTRNSEISIWKTVDLVIDDPNSKLLLLQDVGLNDRVSTIELNTGAREIFSNAGTPDTTNPFGRVTGITLDHANNRALVTDEGKDSVTSVSLFDGSRTTLSDSSTPDGLHALSHPIAIALDTARNRAIVLDKDLQALVAVALNNGARTILSDNTTPNTLNPFSDIKDITVDETNDRALVSDRLADTIYSISLEDGTRTILSDAATPDNINPFSFPSGIALDKANNRLFLLDSNFVLISVDLTTGARSVVSDSNAANRHYSGVSDIIFDENTGQILVSPDNWAAIIAIDTVTGERVIHSK